MIKLKKKQHHRLSELNQKIEGALITNLFQQAKIGFWASFLVGTIALCSLFYTDKREAVLLWYAATLLIILLRIILVRQFFKSTHSETNLLAWRNLFILGTFLNGICWGLLGTPLLLPNYASPEQSLLIVSLAGMCAGSVPLLSYVRTTVVTFLIPALFPLAVYFYTFNFYIAYLMATATLIYFICLMALGFKTHTIIKNAVRLRFENTALLKVLSHAKHDLELTNKKLADAASHDPLTKVANRTLFLNHFEEAIQRAKKSNKILALLYIDIDKFKWVNDLYGHQAGDQLLIAIVQRVKQIADSNDIISRMGGDELTILLEDVSNPLSTAEYAEKICTSVAKPIKLGDIEIQVKASIGISLYPIDGTDVDTLINVADKAMYYVKKQGGNNYHFNVQLEET